jgi:hypothetical protein
MPEANRMLPETRSPAAPSLESVATAVPVASRLVAPDVADPLAPIPEAAPASVPEPVPGEEPPEPFDACSLWFVTFEVVADVPFE